MNTTNADYFTFNVNNSMLLIGQTGAGKSELVRKYLRRLESAYTPEEMKYVIFDMKQVEFPLDDPEGAKKEYLFRDIVLNSGEEGLSVLEDLALMSKVRAKQTEEKSTPMIFIYVEECDIAAYNQERFDRAVMMINQNAKSANIKLIYSTSSPSDSNVSNRLFESFELVLYGRLVGADYERLGLDKSNVLSTHPFELSVFER